MAKPAAKVAAKPAAAAAAPVKTVGKAAPVKDKPAPEPEPEAEAPVARTRAPRGVSESAVITVLVEGNPKREGSKAHAVFSHYVNGMTIAEFGDALAASELEKETTPNLVYDAKHGFIQIEGYEPPGGVVGKEPKAPKEPKTAKGGKAKAPPAEEPEASEEVID